MKKKTHAYKRKIITFRSKRGFDEKSTFMTLDMLERFWILLMIDTTSGKMTNDVLNCHAPIKKMQVGEKDVPTLQWKKAIRNKRKYTRTFSKERTKEIFEMKKRWRNEATKVRHRAIKEYWQQMRLNHS